MAINSRRSRPRKSGLGFIQILLVVSSLSPVFLLWAIRGVGDVIPDIYWVPGCLFFFIVPNFTLFGFLQSARKGNREKTITVARAEDQRDHLFVYLFAILIPLFDVNLDTLRDVSAVSLAMVFVIFLFWHLGLHYINLGLAIVGFRIFRIEVASGTDNEFSTYAVVSRRSSIPSGKPFTGIRMGGNVLVDRGNSNDRF